MRFIKISKSNFVQTALHYVLLCVSPMAFHVACRLFRCVPPNSLAIPKESNREIIVERTVSIYRHDIATLTSCSCDCRCCDIACGQVAYHIKAKICWQILWYVYIYICTLHCMVAYRPIEQVHNVYRNGINIYPFAVKAKPSQNINNQKKKNLYHSRSTPLQKCSRDLYPLQRNLHACLANKFNSFEYGFFFVRYARNSIYIRIYGTVKCVIYVEISCRTI